MTTTGNATPTILVPVDGSAASEHAAGYAARILRQLGQLKLVQVITSTEQEAIDETYESLVELGQRLGLSGDPEIAVVVGNPAEEILRAASTPSTRMIVMATRGRGAAGRAIFGSVADRVSRNAPRPTLLIRGDVLPPAPARLVVPLDGSALAEAAVPIAAEMSAALEVGVTLVRVIDIADVLAELRGTRVDRTADDAYEQARLLQHADAEAYLASAVARTPSLPAGTATTVLGGTPAHVLLDLFAENDLVVMTSRGHGGAQRWLLGSTAEKLVRESVAPVLLVPDATVEPFI